MSLGPGVLVSRGRLALLAPLSARASLPRLALISKNNFHSGCITPASRGDGSAPCVRCALALRAFFAYHVFRLEHPDGPFSFPKRPVCLSRPILSHHGPQPYLFVSGVRRTPIKLSALGAAVATPPLPAAWIRPLASQNASFAVCPPPPFYRHTYRTMEKSLVVTIR